MSADSFLGIDYGVRKVAWCLLRPAVPEIRVTVGELVLKAPRKGSKKPCDICQQAQLVEYMHAEVFSKRVDVDTVVAIEAPITGMSMDKRTSVRMGMVAGALSAAAMTKTDKHMLLPPSLWKKYAVGHGSASKADVQTAMRVRYWPDIPDEASQDVHDSIGIATAAMRLWREEEGCGS